MSTLPGQWCQPHDVDKYSLVSNRLQACARPPGLDLSHLEESDRRRGAALCAHSVHGGLGREYWRVGSNDWTGREQEAPKPAAETEGDVVDMTLKSGDGRSESEPQAFAGK